MNWYEALAYANWLDDLLRRADGRRAKPFAKGFRVRLPSEAQWEKAARGRKGYRWPWGDDWLADHANTGELDLGATTPVGLFPVGASPYGCQDMAGNVWEWTSSRWGTDLDEPDHGYPYQPSDGREVLSGNDFRVMRGGSWVNPLGDTPCAFRGRINPVSFGYARGFRLVLSLIER